jgi:hypothetical protein
MVQSVLGPPQVLKGRHHENVCQQHARLTGLQPSKQILRQLGKSKKEVFQSGLSLLLALDSHARNEQHKFARFQVWKTIVR